MRWDDCERFAISSFRFAEAVLGKETSRKVYQGERLVAVNRAKRCPCLAL
jgi:hypothetical protein